MSDPVRSCRPDGGLSKPVEFHDEGFREWSAVTVILLGGVGVGLIISLWYLFGG